MQAKLQAHFGEVYISTVGGQKLDRMLNLGLFAVPWTGIGPRKAAMPSIAAAGGLAIIGPFGLIRS